MAVCFWTLIIMFENLLGYKIVRPGVGVLGWLRLTNPGKTRICAAEMAVRYAALSECRKVHVCHGNSLGGAT